MKKIGFGIFSWNANERRSNRYGSFGLHQSDYNNKVKAVTDVSKDVCQEMIGKRVHITCKVIESRESSHFGDMFLQILPTKPDVGEIVDLGVGIFDLLEDEGVAITIVLKPGDNRKELWIDPRKLYRLHDQTVEVYAEETSDDFTPVADLNSAEEGAISNGDGSFQVKGVNVEDPNFRIYPNVDKIGDGMFCIGFPTEKGARVRTKA